MMVVRPGLDDRAQNRREVTECADVRLTALLQSGDTMHWSDGWRRHALEIAAVLINGVIDLDSDEREKEAAQCPTAN